MRLTPGNNPSAIKLRLRLFHSVAMIGLLVLGISGFDLATAQTVGWDEPINISDSPNHSMYPSVVADPAGSVHATWCEASLEAVTSCDAIFYARTDGQAWSQPVDVVVAPGSERVSTPVLAIDTSGTLHVAWVGGYGDRIMYSQAYAPLAGSAMNWSEPALASSIMRGTSLPDLAVDGNGAIHLVFAVENGEGSGILHSQSLDDGWTWVSTSPVFSNVEADLFVTQPRLAIDAGGGLHVAWSEANFPETFPPVRLRYARSLDGGNTWTEELSIPGPYSLSGILAPTASTVHLVWSGTTSDRSKFHAWSSDRGLTWRATTRTLEVGGQQGWPALAADTAGDVHLFQVSGDGDESLKYQVWRNGIWSPATILLARPPGAPNNPVNADLAIGLGNQIHGVVSHFIETPPGSGNWQYDVYYLKGIAADAPGVEPQELPVASPTVRAATSTPFVVTEATSTPWPTALSDQGWKSVGSYATGSFSPTLVGGLFGAAVVALVTVVSVFNRRRR